MDDLYNGVFTYRRAYELRRWDVLFDPVCQALDDPCALSARVLTVKTSAGPRAFGIDQMVWVFRPSSPLVGCEECGAGSGEPCDPVTCCALATLADAAEAARVRQ